jgi:serine/threonine protein kinase
MANETKKENDYPAATILENDQNNSTTTTLENEIPNSSKRSLLVLPTELEGKYQVERQLETRGNEADLLVVVDRQTNEKNVIKLYRKGIRPKPEIMELIKSLDRNFIIGQFSYGISDGYAYEIMELAECSLADLMGTIQCSQTDLYSIVEQLTKAVSYLHGLTPPIVHRDLKPDNILVRDRESLKLVLADFSFASLIEGGSRVATTRHRTPMYSAPEADAGDISPAADWWSIGMIIAELAIGRHPFTGCDDRAVSIHIVNRKPIPLSGISDPRVMLLCQGLLVYEQSQRWGLREIQSWLDGDTTLQVPLEDFSQKEAKSLGELRATRPYKFGSHDCWTARELAAAMCANWDLACRDISRYQMLHDWLKDHLSDHNIVRGLEDLVDGSGFRHLDVGVKVSLFLAVLDPDLPLIFEGSELTPQRMYASTALDRWQNGGAFSQIWSNALALSQLPNMKWLEQGHQEWTQAWKEVNEIDQSMRAMKADLPHLNNTSSLAPFVLSILADQGKKKNLQVEAKKVLNSAEAKAIHWSVPLRREPLNNGALWLLNIRKEEIVKSGSLLLSVHKRERIKKYSSLSLVGFMIFVPISLLYWHDRGKQDSNLIADKIPQQKNKKVVRVKEKTTYKRKNKSTAYGDKPSGSSWGICNKLVIGEDNLSNECEGRIYWQSNYSYQKVNYPDLPDMQIIFSTSGQKENLGFSIENMAYHNKSSAEFKVDKVVFSEGNLPASGNCSISGLNNVNPKLTCSAVTKSVPPKNFTASFVYDESKEPAWSRQSSSFLGKTAYENERKKNRWNNIVVAAKVFFDNPDGHCADPKYFDDYPCEGTLK